MLEMVDGGMPPPVLSPRTLALKAISQICKDNDSPDTRQILANLTDRLFDFVHNGWEVSRDDGMAVTDGGIALCLLESYSIAAMESDAGPIWTSRHLPVVADMITSAMARPVMNFGEFECTALKLALNTTNNNPAAANVFSRGELLNNRESSVMADSVEKTSVAVAHGYLAILLGYLSLGSRVRRRLEEKSQGSGTTYLLNSIQQFMNLHDKVETDEMTTSLQRLVNMRPLE
ncbi:hypothetical protein Cob_v012135 [Colletotrichum orbiculare MAFF 240422]|uniref:Wings apart-like protein C-terminal domain-containing protein n=1 Tax=Colletotrichum orbiculare (strain 104-T / ATCC 96160 / CBS 514.97 / LARS 414 / MAFF 240422) TaxID=1213857 RepID=A0A484FBQ5_COLOR|nr:hypothetical protein Cob_v012135 [Colletotrichum orbiculare MAFF 240422]